MRWLVCGGRKYGEIPMNDDGNGPNRNHPDFPARDREFGRVMEVLYGLAQEHSEHYLAGDNWLPSDIEIISGKARGADSCAIEWAVVNWCHWHEFPAKWDDLSHPDANIRTRWDGTKYDAKAGTRRNQQMLDEGRPDLVVAFLGGTGTADMIRRAEKAGVKVIKITE